jgi:TatD family-associated radical SAM protein
MEEKMVLYTVTGAVGTESYCDISKSGDLTGKNIYVNMTNKCPCNCVFCLRYTKELMESNTLWLKEGEPSVDEVIEMFDKYDLSVINEIVFCGYGEPLERLYDVCEVIDRLREKYPDLNVRVNTIGLANLIYEKDITPELKVRVDTVSISLNSPDAQEFLEITRSRFGIQSYEALKEFAVLAKQYVPNVVMTVVEKVMSEEKIEQCRKICEELGVELRVRPFET